SPAATTTGHRDPCAAPPGRRAATATRRPADPIPSRRAVAAGRLPQPAPPSLAAATTAADPPRYRPTLASRSARPSPPPHLAPPPAGSTTNAALDPRPGAAAGSGERQLGLPTPARRTAHPRR